MNCTRPLLLLVFTLFGCAWSLMAGAPPKLNHQGRVRVSGVKFDGTGLFKFAFVNASGTTTYWSNDGTSVGGSEPASAVSLTVTDGLYSVMLGDTAVPNMAALDPTALQAGDLRLRVWFSDGTHGSELLTPDQPFGSVPFALVASQVQVGDVVAPPQKPVLAWGKNTDGQTTVPALTGVASVAASSTQSLALLKNGTVVAWGGGPVVPGALAQVTQLAAGTSHYLVRKSDGTIVCWGDNSFGKATPPGGLANVVRVAAGEKHSLALRADGTVVAWGDNSFDQITVPSTAVNVTALASGYDHCLALKADGSVVAWGRNDSGQTDVPTGLSNVIAVGAGAYHSLAVKQDGTVVAWGWNGGGQCNVPTGLSSVAKVVGGYAFSIALKSDGTPVAWGDNSNGQTKLPPTATQITSIATFDAHVVALRADLVPAQIAKLDQDNTFNGRIGIGRSAASNALEVEGQASKSVAGNWAANSDRRIKTDIQPISDALEKIDRVRLVDFRYTDDYRTKHPGIDSDRYINVIAQEFAEVFPRHVRKSGEKLSDGSDILQVDTYPLTIYSAAAVQELHRENEALKKQLAAQEERLRRLEAAEAKK